MASLQKRTGTGSLTEGSPRIVSCLVTVAVLGMLWASLAAAASRNNGFVIGDALIEAGAIAHGGPPRDGIPAIDRPRFLSAGEVHFLEPGDRILGFDDGNGGRAYPVRILNWHEIVNDTVDGQGLLVTYCPLCGSGMAFSVAAGDSFGVSGLLYNSDVLLYDRHTESLWSQIMAQAVTGERRGETLAMVNLLHTTWEVWRARYPETRVLSTDNGHRVDYRVDPYEGYERSRQLYFSVGAKSRSYHPKEWVLGIVIDGSARAYPYSELEKGGDEPVVEVVGDHRLRIHFERVGNSAWVEQLDGEGRVLNEVPAVRSFWFAWYAFHPETSIFVSE